jgi:hypothetical protein
MQADNMQVSAIQYSRGGPVHLRHGLCVSSRLVCDHNSSSKASIFVDHVDAGTVSSDDAESRRGRLVQLGFGKLADSHYWRAASTVSASPVGRVQRPDELT